MLQATENEDKLHFENSSEIINLIFDKAEENYDSILLDAHSGSQHAVTNQLLQSSDLVVVCLSQDRNVLDKYFDPSRRYWPEALHHIPHMLVIGRYDARSKYKVRNIAGKYSYKGDIFPFSYNTGFRDSMNDGNLRSYFLENQSVPKQHENYRFIQDIREIAAYILEKTEVFVPIQQAERRVP
ncbi:hypothetical protein [Paenibacillus yonginensis]|uniref:hypothetical protein n=1 Tax=Paenibacillus yonginensis TaxID=1462996 RepID=UPI001471A1AD|nr:hypothetical protein [Paenibacillus yonginensis]